MKKYIFISSTYPPQFGGVAVHLQNVHRRLKDRGYDGDVLVLGDEPGVVEDEVIWLARKKLFRLFSQAGRNRTSARIANILRDGKYSVWHFHDFEVYKYFMMVPLKTLDVPKMYMTFHGWEGKCPLDPEVIKWRQEIGREMDGSMAAGYFIPKWYDTPVDIVTCGGVDAKRFSSIKPPTGNLEPTLAYLGGLRKDTGISEIVDSLVELKKNHPMAVPLKIYGTGVLKSELEKRAKDNGLDVTFNDPVKDVLPIYSESMIVFVSGYLSILESLSSQRFVFSYYNNHLREDYLRMHPAADSLFICGSPQEMARQLLFCLNDLDAAVKKSKPGWEWAREQTWDRLVGEYLSLWGWS